MDIAKRIISRKFWLKAPAKVNLALSVVGRRADGFHELSMFNAATSYCDEIEITFNSSARREIEILGELKRDSIPNLDSNLITKAVNLAFGTEIGFAAKLLKNIPIGGGLGGGSSNAGAILRLALHLFSELKQDIYSKASDLGSDVPYFLSPNCFSLVEGIGEKLLNAPSTPLNDYSIYLFFPKLSVATPDAYRWYKESGKSFSPALDILSWEKIIGRNDLESPVTNKYPVLKSLLNDLRSLIPLSGMSGSGSTLFALNKGEANDSTVEDWALEHGVRVHKASFLNSFPSPVEVTA